MADITTLSVKFLQKWESDDGEVFEVGDGAKLDTHTAEKLKAEKIVEELPDDDSKDGKQTAERIGSATDATLTTKWANAPRLSDEDNDRIGKIVDAVVAKHTDPIRKRISIQEQDPEKFKTLPDFFGAVCKYYGGQKIDNRLKKQWGSPCNSQHTKLVGSDEQMAISDPHGGFLIPTQQITELLTIPPEEDPLGARTRKIRMQSPTVEFNARVDKNHSSSVSGGLTLAYTEETAPTSTSRQAYEKVRLEAHELTGAAFVTEKLLRDSPISAVDLLSQGFRDEFISVGIDKRLNGVGVGEPLGVLNAPCTISISKETGQAATTVVTENVLKMRARCWGYGKAFWLANHDTYPTLAVMKLDVGTGGAPMYTNSVREDRPDLLLGRPIFYSEYPASVGTVGDLILGNWGEYFDGVREDVEMASSIHVRFLNREQCFRFTLENDGQPWWKSVLTPKNGDTLSPFVTLATRS